MPRVGVHGVSRGRGRPIDGFLATIGQAYAAHPDQVDPSEFLDSLVNRTFLIRAVVETGPPAVLRRMVADDLPRTQRVGRPSSAYGALTFVEARVHGRTIARWIRELKGRVGGLDFEIPELNSWLSGERHASHTRYSGVSLPWPILRFTISTKDNHSQSDRGFLIKPGLPSFQRHQDALSYYLYPGEPVSQQGIPDGLIVIRIADTRCWIDRMEFASTHVTVTLKGSQVQGASIELVGPSREVRLVDGPGRAKIPLPGGLDDSQWLFVTNSGAWLDQRYLGKTIQYENRTDASFEPPDDATQLAVLTTQGESQTVEYKRQLPASPSERAALSRTVIAFANTQGGCIIYGVEEDGSGGARVVGVRPPPAIADDLVRIVHDTVVPDPGVKVAVGDMDGKRLVAVVVPSHRKRFFALAGAPPRFFVRRQANTYEARLDDIRGLAESLAEQQVTPPFWPRHGS